MKRILHVEVGGAYGGSVRALEVYLAHTKLPNTVHDILLYYPTENSGRLSQLANSVQTLFDYIPQHLQLSIGQSGNRVRLSNTLRRLGVLSAAAEVRQWLGLARALPFVRRLACVMRAGHYDLVHVNNTPPYKAETTLAARLACIPVIAHVRNPVPSGWFSRCVLRWAGCMTTVNAVYADELRSLGLPVEVLVCYDGLELQQPDGAESGRLRAELLGSGDILVGSVGRLHQQKGYEDLVRAAKAVVQHNSKVRFAVAADGPERLALHQLISDSGLEGKFTLCGFRRDIPEFLAALDVFVSSSHWEGLPLAVVEAVMLAKPIVATRVGGTPEVVTAGKNGELVTSGAPDAMAAAILLAIAKHKVHGYALEEERCRIGRIMDASACAGRFDEVIEHLLGSVASIARSSHCC